MKQPTEEIHIRHMGVADVEWAQECADASPQAPRWPRAAYLAAIDPEAAPRRIALVAERPVEGTGMHLIMQRLGFIVASLVPHQAELETIVVESEVRRQGVARLLMAALQAGLQAANVTEVTLEVRACNQPALEIYRALGFLESGRRLRYYADPVEDAIVMRLALG
jgi:ribosomal-protein-alanine acetyltransferase